MLEDPTLMNVYTNFQLIFKKFQNLFVVYGRIKGQKVQTILPMA